MVQHILNNEMMSTSRKWLWNPCCFNSLHR